MERRKFLKSSCNICLLAATGYFLSEFAACSPAAFHIINADIINDEIKIPVASFAQSATQIVRPKGWYYDIAVQKKDNNIYEALLLQCTHQNNQLIANNQGYTCTLHGSQFNKDGMVTKGPAETPLKKYHVNIDNQNLIINLKVS